MKMIASVDKNWGIGCNWKLLTKIPHDMMRFRRITEGKAVIVGRTTLKEFPNGEPLPYHEPTIIMSTRQDYSPSRISGIIVAHNIQECINHARRYNDDDVYVIGGGTIYNQLLRYCDTAYITKIDHKFNADTWFPNLDKNPDWAICEGNGTDIGAGVHDGIHYEFLTYVRK